MDGHAVPGVDRAIARGGDREGHDGPARSASDHYDAKPAVPSRSRRDVCSHGDAEVFSERGDSAMCGLRAAAVAASGGGTRAANQTEPKIAKDPGERLAVGVPRDHRSAWKHRRIDAREQQELA